MLYDRTKYIPMSPISIHEFVPSIYPVSTHASICVNNDQFFVTPRAPPFERITPYTLPTCPSVCLSVRPYVRPFLFSRTFFRCLIVCLYDYLYVYYHIYLNMHTVVFRNYDILVFAGRSESRT